MLTDIWKWQLEVIRKLTDIQGFNLNQIQPSSCKYKQKLRAYVSQGLNLYFDSLA